MGITARGFQDRFSNIALQIEQVDAEPGDEELVSVRPAGGRSQLRSG